MPFPLAPVEAPATSDGPRIHRRQLAQAINQVMSGKINAAASVTLTPNATSTTLTDSRIGPQSVIVLVPTTQDASALDIAPWINSTAAGSAVVSHGSSPSADLTFAALIIG
jgi:hypothetical protein